MYIYTHTYTCKYTHRGFKRLICAKTTSLLFLRCTYRRVLVSVRTHTQFCTHGFCCWNWPYIEAVCCVCMASHTRIARTQTRRFVKYRRDGESVCLHMYACVYRVNFQMQNNLCVLLCIRE